MSDRTKLRTGFDADAETYDRTRPVCPAEMFDDLVELAGLATGDRVLEIGCGTGQATLPLAERGLVVTATELGSHLAEIARHKLAGFPDSRVITGPFEGWRHEGDSFDAVVVFNALHWIDPELRYTKPAAALRPDGTLIVGSCLWARPNNAHRFWFDVQQDYQAVGYEGEPAPPPDTIGVPRLSPDAQGLFEEVAARRYCFEMSYSPEDYLAILATQSGTRQLGQVRAEEFLDRVRSRLMSLDWPDLTATFVGRLNIARLISTGPDQLA